MSCRRSGATDGADSAETAEAAVPVVIEEAELWYSSKNNANKRNNRYFQLVSGPSPGMDGTQLMLLVFKKRPNPEKLHPAPVGPEEIMTAR